MRKSPNIVRHQPAVTRLHREILNGHRSVNLWFTGLSGSGKSTLAHAVEEHLHLMGCRTYVFDGDNVRHGLCRDLGFSPEDRSENLRRIAEMIHLFIDAGIIALTAFISPLREDREKVRSIVGPENFVEIYCNCPLNICEQRDVKGLYQKARRGEISNYTGISSPYEPPVTPNLAFNTSTQTIDECVKTIINYLEEMKITGSNLGKL